MNFTNEQKAIFGRFYYLRKKAGKPIPQGYMECYEYYVREILGEVLDEE